MSRAAHLTDTRSDIPSARKRSTGEILRRVFAYLRPYWGLAVATISCALVSLAFAFVYPKLIPLIVDEFIARQEMASFRWAVLAVIAAFFLREAFNCLRIQVNNTFEQKVIYDMRRDVFAKLQRLPVGYFDQRSSGDLMTRVIEDVNSVERVLIDGTEQGSVALLSIVGALFFMSRESPILAATALIPLPFLFGGALWYTLTAHRRYRRQRQAASAMNALLMDDLQGVRQIKAFGRQEHEDARFAARAEELRQGTLSVMRVWSYYSPSMAFANALGTGLVLWVGGHQVASGALSVGQLFGFLLYLALFYEPIGRLHGLNQMMQAARAAGERVFEILDTPEERPDRRGELREPVSGEVVYEQVGFSYGPERGILHDINLRAAPGTMTALVGPTGAGKSTLVHLLPAFYEATAGTITIDGQDIGQIGLASLRRHISVVSQEPFLFNGSIRENILYGQLDASEARLIEVAQAANCHDFIQRLPKDYDTQVGERGVRLSVGEKQRVSIARALLKNAPILILDEATASVDTATERLIQQALERLMRGRTSFVIAHRLSTIRSADQILVLREGRIVERGSHDELLAHGGLYARLARIQNTSTIEESFQRLQGEGSITETSAVAIR